MYFSKTHLAALVFVASLALVTGASAEPSEEGSRTLDQMLGFSGGHRQSNEDFNKVIDRLPSGVLRASTNGLPMIWDFDSDAEAKDRVKPESLDRRIKLAHERGMRPIVNLIAIPRGGKKDLFSQVDWYWIGYRFAERFKPGSEWNQANTGADFGADTYMILNEIDGNWYHDDRASREYMLSIYKDMNAEFAKGVRAAYPEAKVYLGSLASAHATKGPFSAREHLKEVAELFHSEGDDRLDGFGVQIYLNEPFAKSTRSKLDVPKIINEMREHAGISSLKPDIYSTEMNVRAESAKLDDGTRKKTLTPEEEAGAAKWLLTHIWSHLAISKENVKGIKEPGIDFVLPFSPFSIGRGQWVSLSQDSDYDASQGEWEPNERGKVVQLVMQLTKGMRLKEIYDNPGVVVATGEGRKLWAFRNVPGLTNVNGGTGTEYNLRHIPDDARVLRVYYYDSVRFDPETAPQGEPVPAQEIPLEGIESFTKNGSVMLRKLRPGETVMLVASQD